jgi:hypothetical protein
VILSDFRHQGDMEGREMDASVKDYFVVKHADKRAVMIER